ncbi:hypothetical protein P609_11165 [Comamonas thiooxydans]|nr:hypothetical protein P609_11165 [Comamonas thiooxydans]
MLFGCHVMKTNAIAFLLTSICFATLSERAIGQDTSSIAKDVKKAAADSLKTYTDRGTAGLIDAVSGCWSEPRDFCLYLDFASHRIALSAIRTGVSLDKYFHTAAVIGRAHVWLTPNGRGQKVNEQYLHAVDQVMTGVLNSHREK